MRLCNRVFRFTALTRTICATHECLWDLIKCKIVITDETRHDTTDMYSDCQTKIQNETIVIATMTDWSL